MVVTGCLQEAACEQTPSPVRVCSPSVCTRMGIVKTTLTGTGAAESSRISRSGRNPKSKHNQDVSAALDFIT